MIPTLLLFNIVLNIYCIWRRKNDRLIGVFSVLSIIIIMGLNSFTADYNHYKFQYDAHIIAQTMEGGFAQLTSIARNIDLTYAQFIFFFFLGCIIVGIIATMKITSNYHIVLLMYMTTALFLNTDEVRQTAAYLLYALGLVSLQDNKNGKIKYCIMILLASSMQISSLALLPFPLFLRQFWKRNNLLKMFFLIVVFFCMMVFVNGNKIPLLYEVASVVLPQSKLIYFETSTRFGFLKYFLCNALNLCVALYSLKEINNCPDFYNKDERQYAKNFYYSILYLSFAMPLCMVNGEFLRYFRFSVFPCILLISILVKKSYYTKNFKRNISYLRIWKNDAVMLAYIISYQFLFQHYRAMSEVLQNNAIDNYFK